MHFVAFGMYHSCLVIFSDFENTHHITITRDNFAWQQHPSKDDTKFFTIGAGGDGLLGFAGNLQNDYNRPKDIKLDIAVEMQKIGNKTKDEIQTIVKYHEYYFAHEKAGYIPTPSKNSNKYNCNSFAHGLLNAANISCSKPTHKVPGWDKPLPEKYFGV